MTGRFCFKHIFTTDERIAMPRLAPSRRYAPRLFSNIPAVLLAVLLLFSCAAKANLLEPEPQVIINNDVQLPAGFSSASLRSIFFGRMQTWPDGTPITVFVLPESHPLHRRFCTLYLKTFPYVLQRQWDHLIFTGSAVRPTEVTTTYKLYERVRATPGAIGYINRLPGNTNDIKFVGSDRSPETERTIRF